MARTVPPSSVQATSKAARRHLPWNHQEPASSRSPSPDRQAASPSKLPGKATGRLGPFQYDNGEPIAFYIQNDLPAEFSQRLANAIEVQGGHVIRTLPLPSHGIVLNDPRTPFGRRLLRKSTEKWAVVPYTFVRTSIFSRSRQHVEDFRDVKPIFEVPEQTGTPLRIYVSPRIGSPDTIRALQYRIAKYGGTCKTTPQRADFIIGGHEGSRRLANLRELDDSDVPIESIEWLESCIEKGDYTTVASSSTPAPPRIPSPRLARTEYSAEDNLNLVKFFAERQETRIDPLERSKFKWYTFLSRNLDVFPWFQHHTESSWQNHYVRNKKEFDTMIQDYIQENPHLFEPTSAGGSDSDSSSDASRIRQTKGKQVAGRKRQMDTPPIQAKKKRKIESPVYTHPQPAGGESSGRVGRSNKSRGQATKEIRKPTIAEKREFGQNYKALSELEYNRRLEVEQPIRVHTPPPPPQKAADEEEPLSAKVVAAHDFGDDDIQMEDEPDIRPPSLLPNSPQHHPQSVKEITPFSPDESSFGKTRVVVHDESTTLFKVVKGENKIQDKYSRAVSTKNVEQRVTRQAVRGLEVPSASTTFHSGGSSTLVSLHLSADTKAPASDAEEEPSGGEDTQEVDELVGDADGASDEEQDTAEILPPKPDRPSRNLRRKLTPAPVETSVLTKPKNTRSILSKPKMKEGNKKHEDEEVAPRRTTARKVPSKVVKENLFTVAGSRSRRK